MKTPDMYRQQMIATMTQGEMLHKLYDETIKQMGLAEAAIAKEDIETMHICLTKALKIISHLRASLDFSYPVSKQLASLYNFLHEQLVMANVKKSAVIIQDMLPLVKELRATFDACDKLNRTQNKTETATGKNNLMEHVV